MKPLLTSLKLALLFSMIAMTASAFVPVGGGCPGGGNLCIGSDGEYAGKPGDGQSPGCSGGSHLCIESDGRYGSRGGYAE